MGSGFASSNPRIQGSGPGAGSGVACGGMGGGADGVTEAGAFCPIIVRALTDAASIAFTNSRRRISLLLRRKNSPTIDRGGRKPHRLAQIKIVKSSRFAMLRRRAEKKRLQGR
jgi:hypothetical protein